MARKNIWTGREPYLKGHNMGNKNLKFIFVALFVILIILIFAAQTLKIPGENPTGSLIKDTKAEKEEDLSKYDGLSNKELLEKLYEERGINIIPDYPVKEFKMVAKNYVYDPSIIQVNQNDKVIIKFHSLDNNHSIRIPGYFVSKKVDKGQTTTIEFHATRAGEYTFYSPEYEQMRGKIIVNEKK